MWDSGLAENNSDRWKRVFLVTIEIMEKVTKKMWVCASIGRNLRVAVGNWSIGELEKWRIGSVHGTTFFRRF
jgi:hypothetical protein